MLSFPIKLMLLQSSDKPFDSPNHIYEWKVDGIRCVMFYDHGKVRLQSKTGKDCTKAFPELWSPPLSAEEAIFDGEITVITDSKPDFEGVMERYLASSKKIMYLVSSKPAVYIVWDILWLNGKSVMNLPLMERKQMLSEVLEDNDNLRKIGWVDAKGLAVWEGILKMGLEGMVAKNKNSRYLPGHRSTSWVKVKNYQETIVHVFGYKQKDGAVLVGTGDRVQGHAIGMQATDRAVIRELLEKYGTKKGDTIWLPSGICGRIKFTTWSSRGNMRDCSWVGFDV